MTEPRPSIRTIRAPAPGCPILKVPHLFRGQGLGQITIPADGEEHVIRAHSDGRVFVDGDLIWSPETPS